MLRFSLITGQHGEAAQSKFITAVRTLQYLRQERLRRDGLKGIHISQKDIEKYFFPWPDYERKREISALVATGELKLTPVYKDGRRIWLYTALKPGRVDLTVLPPKGPVQGPLMAYMSKQLMKVQAPEGLTPYFDFFLAHRVTGLNWFFTVDAFAGRVHTPVTSLTSQQRAGLILAGEPVACLDVAQMQPQLLGRILKKNIGANLFSDTLDSGQDIYEMLQEKMKLATRKEAKEKFYAITFAPPTDELSQLFGFADWVEWVNWIKTIQLDENPHSKEKPHSNLAWILQGAEVELMRNIWRRLMTKNIPFLTVHDEIITICSEVDNTAAIMNDELKRAFTTYKLNVKQRTLF